jgi:hypothetical protein
MSLSLIFQTLLSTAAVMATVSVILFVVTGIGLLTSFSWQQGVGVRIRSAIWLGWFWVAVYVSTAHLFFAMKPPVAVPLIIAGLLGWFLLVQKSGLPKFKLRGQPRWVYGTWAALFALFALLSNQTLRTPTSSADSGYYRIPYATWAEAEPLITGLANLNVWLGYGQFTDTLGSFVNTQTFRFLTLLFLTGLIVEILFRIGVESNKRLSGSSQLLGLSYVAIGLVGLLLATPWASYWVSTPTVDVITPVLTIIGIGYLLNWFIELQGGATPNDLLVAIAAMATAAALRTNIALLLLGAIAIVVAFKSSKARTNKAILTSLNEVAPSLFTALGLLWLGLMTMTGNLLRTGFPLFPVSSIGGVDSNWSIGPSRLKEVQQINYTSAQTWVSDLPYGQTPWDLPTILGAALAEPTIQVLMVASVSFATAISLVRNGRMSTRSKRATTPFLAIIFLLVIVTTLTLLFAPNPRYVAGLLMALSSALLAFAIVQFSARLKLLFPALVSLSAALVVVFLQKGYLGSALLNPVMADGSGPFGAHSPPEAVTETFVTNSGLEIKYAPDWLCWATEPPCTFAPNPGLELRGETLREGFRISR